MGVVSPARRRPCKHMFNPLQAGGKVLECLCIVELAELHGRAKVPAPCWALLDLPDGC